MKWRRMEEVERDYKLLGKLFFFFENDLLTYRSEGILKIDYEVVGCWKTLILCIR